MVYGIFYAIVCNRRQLRRHSNTYACLLVCLSVCLSPSLLKALELSDCKS